MRARNAPPLHRMSLVAAAVMIGAIVYVQTPAMKTVFDLKSLVLGAFLGAILVFSAAATSLGARPLWEYKVVSGRVYQSELEKAINNAAADGWELVSASSSVETYAFAVMRRERH